MLQAGLPTEGFLLVIYGYPVVQGTPRAFLGNVGRKHGPRPRTDRAGGGDWDGLRQQRALPHRSCFWGCPG